MMCKMFLLDHVLDHLDDPDASPQGCRPSASTHSRYPYKQRQSFRASPGHSPRFQQADVRELDDSYVVFVDVPGYSKEDVHVNVEDGHLIVTATATQSPDEPSSSKSLWSERPRPGVRHRVRLPEDAMLDGIHAKLNNGELMIAIPKKVPRSFQVPVLGADEDMKPAEPVESAQPTRAIESCPSTAAPVTEAAAPVPVPDQPVAEGAAAGQTALPASETAADAPHQDVAMNDAQEEDGSVEDVSDEEREAEAAERRAKGKFIKEGPVLEEIERQEAEMRAAAADADYEHV